MTKPLVYDTSKYDDVHSVQYTNAYYKLSDLSTKALIKTLETSGKDYLNNPTLMAALHSSKRFDSFITWCSTSPLMQHLREDVRFARTCAQWSASVLDWDPKYKHDPAIVFGCCRDKPEVVLNAPSAWIHDARYVAEFAKHNGNCLYFLPTTWRSDPQVMLDVVVNGVSSFSVQ